MSADSYRTVAGESQHEAPKTKGSRFIATVAPISEASQVTELVERLRGAFPTANHHCYAYRLGQGRDRFRYSDDGEPSGSAGRPILRQIDGRDLTDTVAVVSRIFGGTKLGVGGLIRAYGGAAAEALDRAEIRVLVPLRRVRLTYPYDLEGPIDGLIGAAGLVPVDASYGASIVKTVEISEADAAEFLALLVERTSGRVTIDEAG
jgi:uncharacterized YigZ family protein